MGWILAVSVLLTIASLLAAYHFHGLHESAQSAIDTLQAGLAACEANVADYRTNWQAEMVMSGKLLAENSELKKHLQAATEAHKLVSEIADPVIKKFGAQALFEAAASAKDRVATNGKVAKSGFTLKTSDVLNAGKLTPKKLRQFREQHGISQSDLAKALRWDNLKTGVCVISRYEGGHQDLVQWRIADIEEYMKQQGFNL